MSAYLVTIVVSDPDDATARRVAENVVQLASTAAEYGNDTTETFISDPPTLVVRSESEES